MNFPSPTLDAWLFSLLWRIHPQQKYDSYCSSLCQMYVNPRLSVFNLDFVFN